MKLILALLLTSIACFAQADAFDYQTASNSLAYRSADEVDWLRGLVITLESPAGAVAHSVVLTWTDPNSPTTGDTYNAYRATGICPAPNLAGVLPAAPPFTKLNGAALTVLTYGDSSVTAATTYCYLVSVVNAAIESCSAGTLCTSGNPMITVNVPKDPVGPLPPTGLNGVAK